MGARMRRREFITLLGGAAASCGSRISLRASGNWAAAQIFRIIEPVAGLPRITIRYRPTQNYGHPFAHRSIGSNHIRHVHDGTVVRLTADAPLSFIEHEAPFVLMRPLHLVFGADEQ